MLIPAPSAGSVNAIWPRRSAIFAGSAQRGSFDHGRNVLIMVACAVDAARDAVILVQVRVIQALATENTKLAGLVAGLAARVEHGIPPWLPSVTRSKDTLMPLVPDPS